MKYITQWLLATLVVSIARAAPSLIPFTSIKKIPSTPATGSIVANFISSQYNLDGPQLSAVNTTSFDWWYFDVVSPDLNTSFVIIFFTTVSSGFPVLSSTDITTVLITATFPNGTQFTQYLDATEAIVTTINDGSSGIFSGSGAAWVGQPDLSSYLVTLNAPGIVGTFILKSVAPAHYPCGPAGPGVSMLSSPHIGWANAIPDAQGLVNLRIGGSPLVFTGIAYHDKNWSDEPFVANVDSWYWGHGRLGGYSIVWFDTLDAQGIEHVSAYAAKSNSIITASCQPGSAKVRPTGVNNEYPPTVLTGNPGGFAIELDLGSAGVLSVNVTTASVISSVPPIYARFTGSMVGRLNGGPLIKGGVALFEMFKLTL